MDPSTSTAGRYGRIGGSPTLMSTPFKFTQEFYDRELERTLLLVKGREVHVFGYGSLMWSPEPRFTNPRLARLYGYRRALSVRSTCYRGTHRRPGLVFGLVPGGSCWGKIYSVPKRDQHDMVAELFDREMFAGVYEPRLLWVRPQGGGRVESLAFVTRRTHSSYAHGLDLGEQASMVASARGERGTCLEYVVRTQKCLEGEGVPCPGIMRLLDRISR